MRRLYEQRTRGSRSRSAFKRTTGVRCPASRIEPCPVVDTDQRAVLYLDNPLYLEFREADHLLVTIERSFGESGEVLFTQVEGSSVEVVRLRKLYLERVLAFLLREYLRESEA
ncbi:MAG TPA: hypothetical protein VKR06_02435 [Ktedonosporobacter sp.]|nr:hypothetical protein [Ktedonosporobacter sp.]